MSVVRIKLPVLHAAQKLIYLRRKRRNAVRCGRRFGKDVLMITQAAFAAGRGKTVGLFAPEYKQLTEPFSLLEEILAPVKLRASRGEGEYRTDTGGGIDVWHTNDNDLAGRGREYDEIHINEAAFGKANLMSVWEKSIEPTLLVRQGSAWVYSTPNGNDPGNFFYKVCNDKTLGFHEQHAPTSANPLIPAEYLERQRQRSHPLVFRQEYLAEFVDWSGEAFFSLDKLLKDGKPVPLPKQCDSVFAIIDTAVKTGKENDGTAVVYCARTKYGSANAPLVILDWDVVQIEGALLETWLPTVFQNLERFAKLCGARGGSVGAFIEDAQSGSILLQQARRRGLKVHAIDSTLTSAGKDGRAISVSGYVYRGEVKIADGAFVKTTTFKGDTKNHLVSQITGFRVGDKDAAKRADDLLDCFCYGIALSLGNAEGQ
jgi:hypothetical protein